MRNELPALEMRPQTIAPILTASSRHFEWTDAEGRSVVADPQPGQPDRLS